MTDFRDSGLPNNPTVFKAFTTYRQNMEGMPAPIRAADAPLKVAQVISQNSDHNNPKNEPVILALLGLMPQETWGVVKKRFGENMAQELAESRLHVATNYAYLDMASPAVKQLTMAGALTAFERVEQSAQEMEGHLFSIKLSGQAPIGFEPPVILLPDTYAKIQRACEGTSGAPALEALYTERFESMKYAQATMIEKMAEVGIFIQGLIPGVAPAELRYPAFEETGLVDTPKIRAAYDVLTRHTNVLPEDFEGALYVGQLLSDLSPTKNPTAIAAALIDVGLRNMNPYDANFLQKKLDWDVMELLNTTSVYTLSHPQQVLGAPVEFRQIAVANAVAVMDDGLKGGTEFVKAVANNPDYPKGAITQSMMQLKRMSIQSQQIFAPALGRTEMPELDRLFTDKIKELNKFIDRHLPRQEPPAPKPSKPKPKNDGPTHD